MKQTDRPLVSIVTPSYNQARFIEQTILTVISQDYPKLEYIVVDGGSTDGTLEILQKYASYVTWISEPDRGQPDARNKGFKMAHGEILGSISSDDLYAPGAIGEAVKFLLDNPECDVVYGGFDVIDENGQVLKTIMPREFDLQRLIQYEAGKIILQATFFRKRVIDSVGPLDISLHYCFDYDFLIRVGMRFKMMRTPQVLASLRFQPDSISMTNPQRHLKEALTVSRRYGGARFSPLFFRIWLFYFLSWNRPINRIWRLIKSIRRLTTQGPSGDKAKLGD